VRYQSKIDLGELLSERRMKSQIRGKRIHQPTVRFKYFFGVAEPFSSDPKKGLQQQGCNVLFDSLNLTG